jgi:hypothetical protein
MIGKAHINNPSPLGRGKGEGIKFIGPLTRPPGGGRPLPAGEANKGVLP